MSIVVCDALNRPSRINSGAVSPAARAIARIAPVRIPPSAVGRITVRIERHRSIPSASVASRSDPGIVSRTSCEVRAINGNITIASASEAAKPDCFFETTPKMNKPITIVGNPCIMSRPVCSTFAVGERREANSTR